MGKGKSLTGKLCSAYKDFQTDLEWSFSYASTRLLLKGCKALRLSGAEKRLEQKRDRFILDYLRDLLQPVFEGYAADQDMGEYVPNAPIWVCWWTGMETAPELVKRCVESIRKNACGHPVHVITRDNVSQYIQIPEFLMRKVENGDVCLANFSDYLRVKLIATYGGLWLDATIFCTGPIPPAFFDNPIYTMKGGPNADAFLSRCRWTGFCLGGWKGNLFYRMLVSTFERYWQNNQHAITYLFFDYLILLLCEKVPVIGERMEAIPPNNTRRDDLQVAMAENRSTAEAHKVICEDTVLYKLSWKGSYETVAADGSPSLYGALLLGTLA